jgi:hypothetical protein
MGDMASTASTTSSFGGMVQWRLGEGCVMMNMRRVAEPYGTIEASTTKLEKNMQIFSLKIARWFDSDDDFYSVCMTCSLKVRYTR